jgi:hypothetical protein
MLPRTLFAASLIYLAVPYVVFFIGWLQPWWAVPAVLLVAAMVLGAIAWQRRMPHADEDSPSLGRATLLLYLLVCAVWIFIAGVGGYGYQTSDWIKHEALLKDLIEQPWPVIYEYYTLPVAQVYYNALYLPVAVVGKLWGWQAANAALFAWALMGMLLAALWFSLLVRKFSGWVLTLFLFFAGLDWVGLLIVSAPNWQAAIVERWREVEDWVSLILQYDSLSNMLFWAPQHAIAGWLAGAMTFYLIKRQASKVKLVPLALTGLWSPFVTIGLLPLLLLDWLAQRQRWRRLADYLHWPNLGAVALLALTALYYNAKLGLISPMLEGEMPHSFLPADPPISMMERLWQLLLFMLIEFGLYSLLVMRTTRSEDRPVRQMAWAVLLTLVLLPLYSIGLNNDLALRATIPALFLLAVLVARALINNSLTNDEIRQRVGQGTRRGLLILFLVGALTTLSEVARQISPFVDPTTTWQVTDAEKGKGIEELFAGDATRFTQYVGNVNAPFFRLLAKPSQPRPSEVSPPYVSYDNKILLADYQLSPQVNVQPGSTVELLLTLHVFTDVIDQNYGLSLRLIAENGEEIWSEQGWPQNRPTAQEVDELIWHDLRQISIPADAAPGFYRLELAVVDGESQSMLPAYALPEDVALGDMVPIGYLIVGPLPQELIGVWPHPILLGGGLAALGATLQPDHTIAPGETLTVTLRWQARTAVHQNYTAFVHLLAPDGTLVAQWDQPPRNGFLPTRIWRADFSLDERYPLTLPSASQPGNYTVVAGFYDATGKRLPVMNPGRATQNSLSDTFQVGTIQVE